jgi:hypothetical protein
MNDIEKAALVRAGELATAFKIEFPGLERQQMATAARTFQRGLSPPRRPGRKRHVSITRAVSDFIHGFRGIELYRRNIRGWEHMSPWRRAQTSLRLVNAIYKRLSRAKPKAAALLRRHQVV